MALAGPEVGSSAGINNMASGFSRICRTCAACTDCLMPIFSGEGLLNNLADKIQRHLPIQVSEWDRLPQQLCSQCASTLLAWHELVKCCSQADVALRTRLQRIQELAGEENIPTTSGPNSTSLHVPKEQTEQIVKSEGKEIDFRRYLEGILLNYIDVTSQNSRRADTAANIIYACQKCEKYSPFHTVEALAEHLQQIHVHEIPDEAGVAHFVTENLILVETLDESLDDKNVIIATEIKANVDVAPVRARRRPDATDESLDKLCCPFCQKIFSAPKRLIVHLSIHPEVSVDGRFECRCCAVVCTDARGLVEHLQRAHVTVEIEGTQQVCRSCGFVCSTTPDLHHHVRTFHAAPSSQPLKPPPSTDPRVCQTNPKYIPVECPVCSRIVSNKYNLNAHMRQHARRTDSFACSDCGRTYRSRGSLKWHKETVHLGILRYICPECGEAFPSKMYRDVHRRIHSGETPFQCESCGKSFRSKNSLVAHVKSHLGIRNYPCTRCPKRFQKNTHLNYHLRSHERKDLKKKLSTEPKANIRPEVKSEVAVDDKSQDLFQPEIFLKEEFDSGGAPPVKPESKESVEPLETNSTVPDTIFEADGKKMFACSVCGKKMALSTFKRHMRVHSGDRRYHCHTCGLGFSDAGNLSRHTRSVHARVKPFPCITCDASFSRKSHLEDHTRRHTNERAFVCDTCGKTSKSKSALRIHKKIHDNALQFACLYCDKAFKRRHELNAHVTVHSGERAHECACGRNFRLKSQLSLHARTHQPAHPSFQCHTCAKPFRQERYLKHHMKKKHTG